MQWVADNVTATNRAGKAVMNMSLGGSFSQALNDAIQALHDIGIVPVVAAGNEDVSQTSQEPTSRVTKKRLIF